MVRLPWILFPLLFLAHIYSKSIPSFRVIAPQTICEEPETESLFRKQQFVTITLFPRNREQLTYNFQIFFKNLGNYQSQRRTLELWNYIRSLEYRVNVRDRLELSETNLLIINKNELTPGMAYVFHVSGTAKNGISAKGQNFTIKYIKGDATNGYNKSSNDVNLVLVAPEYILAGIPFVAVAKVEFCPPRFDYFFEWNIAGLDKQAQKDLRTPRSTLTIPGGTLKEGQDYQVEVSVLQTNNSKKIAGTAFPFKVLTKGFELFIIPTSVNAGLAQPIVVEIIINDFDGGKSQVLEILWTSTTTLNVAFKCRGCGRTNKTRIETSFDAVGNYTITARVKKGAIIKAITSKVTITSTLLYFEFSNIPNPSITVDQDFKISLIIKNLIPKCEAEWMSIQRDGFEFLPQLKNELKHLKVNNLEENYLAELSDFGNSTKSELFPLTIPHANWLKGNGKYKLRLQVTCPNLFLQEKKSLSKQTESWFEFDLLTKDAPQGAPLEVRPTSGLALQTIFQFTTNGAKDTERNLPLRYEFFYKMDNFTISVGSYYEYRTAETILPYSDSTIQTFYKVCNVRSACSTIDGPLIKVNMGEMIAQEAQQKLQEIALAFERQDFFQGQTLMLICALSYRKTDSKIYDNFKNRSIHILFNVINKQYQKPSFHITNDDIYKFVRVTKEIFEVLDVNNAEMIRKLLNLLETLSEETNPSNSFRKKRELEILTYSNNNGKIEVDSDFAQLSLELMERLLKSIDENNRLGEKQDVLEKINKLIVKLCKSNKILKESIRTNLAIIDVWKLKGNDIIGTRFSVTHYMIPKIAYLTINLPKLRTNNEFCLTLAQFPDDLYSTQADSAMYKIQLLNNFSLYSESQASDDQIFANALDFLLPTTGGSEKCLMRINNEWIEDFCTTLFESDSIKCSCRTLGYLRLSANLDQRLTSIASKSSTTVSTPRRPTRVVNDENMPSVSTTLNIISLTSTSPKSLITSQGDITTSPSPTTAPITAYIIPLVGLALIATVIGGAVVYKRSQKNDNLRITGIESIEPREQIPGLKYGQFHDEHLLVGSF